MAGASTKRVAVVSINRGPSDPRAMQKEALSLERFGYDVTYICNAASGPMVTEDRIHMDALKMPVSRLALQARGPGIMLREALHFCPDVLHVLDTALIEPAIRFGLRHGVKIVVDLPEDTPKQILQKTYLGSMATRQLVSANCQRLLQRLLPQADLVIAATPSIAASLPVGCQHIVVRNYAAIADIDAVSSSEPASSETDTQALRVMYVGGISSIRGIRELVAATDMLRGAVKLHLAGPVYDARFFRELESMTGWQYCQYHGWLDWRGSIALVKSCDVGACVMQAAANQVEALPVKIFEYMACGKGSIVSSFPLWRRLFAGAALFADPTEPASIARLMKQLLTEPVLLRKLAERGRLLAETRYSWEPEAGRLADGYAGLWSVTQR